MRTIDFWKTKLKEATVELSKVGEGAKHYNAPLPGPPPTRDMFKGSWRRARDRWLRKVDQARRFKKLTDRIAYYNSRIEALRNLPRAARALRNPPI
jgi:hypothetical protein